MPPAQTEVSSAHTLQARVGGQQGIELHEEAADVGVDVIGVARCLDLVELVDRPVVVDHGHARVHKGP